MEKGQRLFRAAATRPCISEPLEGRLLLSSAAISPAGAPNLKPTDLATPTFIDLGPISKLDVTRDANPDALSAPFDPSQLAQAYGVNLISFGGTAGTGAGQTIAIVDAYNDPDIITDANNFSANYSLPEFNLAGDPTLTVLNQGGGTTLPTNASTGTWDVEESLDVEWAHAIAPKANIILFEANSDEDSDLYAAVTEAADYAGVSVVSMSWSGSEYNGEGSSDSDFLTPAGHQGVTFLASTGDTAAAVGYPDSSPNVIAVGGTSLTINNDGSYGSESAWSDGGGGVSAYESQPSYQTGKVNGASTTQRTTPDVSMDADPDTGVAVLDTYYTSEYLQVGGTSLACPLWAGLIAIVDQGRALDSASSLSSAQTLTALYNLSPSYFHDITVGSNGHSATAGYDMATGIGSPIANLLVPALAGYSTGPMLAFAQQPPASVTAGFTIAPAITVDVENANGAINTADTSSVTLSVYSGPNGPGEPLIGTLTVSAVKGVATFSNVSLDLAGPYTLEATDGTLYRALSDDFNVIAAAAVKLAFVQQPTGTNTNSKLAPAVTVAVEDQYGNLETGNPSSVTVALGTNTTGATLSGTLSNSPVAGIATFGNLSVNILGTYTLTATDGSLTGATSSSFIISGPAAKLVFAQAPTGTGIGSAISPAVTVDVEDANGDIVNNSSNVTISILTGPTGGSLGGLLTVAAVRGVATFSTLWLSLGGSYTLEASDSSLTKAVAAPIVISGSYSMSIIPFNGSNGESPLAPPIMDSSGDLYGTTQFGGADNYGTVFEVVKGSNTIKTLVSFNSADGSYPWTSLTLDSSGDLFGTAGGGGEYGDGTVFEIVKNTTTLVTLASFNDANGNFPRGPVILDSSGDIFGTCYTGGSSDGGDVYEIVKGSGTITVLASFTGPNGEYPTAGLVMDSSGNLYGTTLQGGADGDGEVWEIVNGSNTITVFASFTGTGAGGNGANPWTTLVRDSSGNLYGTTEGGNGTVFEVAANGGGAITTLVTFPNANTYPGSLVLDGNGNLIGVTEPSITAGNPLCGTVFEIAHGSNALTTLASFDGDNGCFPVGVALDSSGDIFGLAEAGGTTSFSTNTEGDGVVFELQAPHLVFLQQPTTVAAGSPIAPAVTVEIENPFNTVITSDDSNITLSIASGPTSTLGGSVTVAANNGIATFSNLTIPTAGAYTLSANYTPNANVTATSSSFVVNAAVANEYLFYYGSSAFDGRATSPSSADYNAIAENANGTDKTALLPGQTATFANVSSYADGINGILIDFANLPAGVTFSASDFAFAVGNNNTPSSWSGAPAPTAVATWTGPNGDTFADITWANNAIQEEWLQVTVLADANTHLASNDVFYFGSLIGATGASTASNGTVLQVTAGDLVATQNNASLLSNVPISSLYDFNRDGYVTASDFVLCQDNTTLLGGLNLITPGSTGNAVVAGPGAGSDAVAATGGSSTAAASSNSQSNESSLLQGSDDLLNRIGRHRRS